MDRGRARELLRSQKPFRVAFKGITRGYKIAVMEHYNRRKQIITLAYLNQPPALFSSIDYYLETVEEFNGEWDPRDVEFMERLENGNHSRRTRRRRTT